MLWIAITSLIKNIKLNLTFSKFVLKPLFATVIMGICSYFTFSNLLGILGNKLAIIVAIAVAIIIYGLAIVVLKIFDKEEILKLPMGHKIFKIFKKLKILKIYKKKKDFIYF